MDPRVRRAVAADAADAGRLLHDFNVEFDEPTPIVAEMARRIDTLMEEGEVTVLLAGEGPDGIAVLFYRPALFGKGLVALLHELYVVPPIRGNGLGRALLETSVEIARKEGAISIELITGETDTAARGLYESTGFTNLEGRPHGPPMLYYEREL